MEPNHLPVDQVAARLGISPGMVRKLLRDGKLSGLPPRDWLVSEASLEAYKPSKRGWIKGRARKPSSPPALNQDRSEPVPEPIELPVHSVSTSTFPELPDFLDPSSLPLSD